MNDLVTPENIMFVLGLIGIGYTVFRSIYGQQMKGETADLLINQRANFLRDEYEKKFLDIQSKFDELSKVNQNHLHTIENKLDSLSALVVQQGKEIVRLQTTIDIKLLK